MPWINAVEDFAGVKYGSSWWYYTFESGVSYRVCLQRSPSESRVAYHAVTPWSQYVPKPATCCLAHERCIRN